MRELDCIQFNEDEESESKRKIRTEIGERINGMNGLEFDFDDSDLDEIQEVIGANIEDEHEAFITNNVESVNSASNSVTVATVPTAIAVVASSFEIAMSRKNESIVRKENNEEVEKILLKIKEHVPEKYCVTFDKVSGFNIERELFF